MNSAMLQPTSGSSGCGPAAGRFGAHVGKSNCWLLAFSNIRATSVIAPIGLFQSSHSRNKAMAGIRSGVDDCSYDVSQLNSSIDKAHFSNYQFTISSFLALRAYPRD
jgi:hypothetical protein